MKLLLILFFVTSLLLVNVDSVSYGRFISIKDAPYFISLLDNEMLFDCAGVIISEYWILTASHCIRGEISNKLIAGSTVHNKLNENSIYNISKIFIPGDCEDRDHALMYNDIALIKLESPIEFNEFKQPIKIRKIAPKDGDVLTIFGFGLQGDAQGFSPVLKQRDVTVISQSICDPIILPYIGKSDSVFCADDPTGGNCPGDSGGPAVIEGQLAGLVSFGSPCKNYRDSQRLPEMYTRVHKFYDWIIKITGIPE